MRRLSKFAKAHAAAGASLLLLLAAPASAGRVLLVGVDGLSWNLVDPMLVRGELPNLAEIVGRGATARLESVKPVRSPVVWTSIATGRRPAAHGVTDFFATRLSVRVPSAFERLAAAGLRVGLYDYLMMWPPPAFPNGFVIPGWLRRDASVTPPDVWGRISLAPFVNSYDGARTSRDYLQRARSEIRNKAARWRALLEAFDLDVGAVTFYAVDMTSHRFWEAGFPDDFEHPGQGYAAQERTAIVDALRGIDRAIGQIAADLTPEDTILIASDHGFRASEDSGSSVWVTHTDELLASAGIEPRPDGFALLSSFGAVSLRVHPGAPDARDALAERLEMLFESLRSEAGERLFSSVEVIDVAPRPPGHERPLWVRLRQWVVRKVATWIFHLTLDPGAHALVFALPDDDVLESLWPDGQVRIGDRRLPLSEIMSRQRFTGRHDPIGVFLAAGGPIARRADRADISVLDIAPLLFHLAGQPVPDDLEGRIPRDFLSPEALAENPPTRVPAGDLPKLPDAAQDTPALSDPGLVEKLRALGYMP